MTTVPFDLRAAAPNAELLPRLGPLAELAGTWAGNGYNLIAVPKRGGVVGEPFRLILNATKEMLTFMPIGAPIPNRGNVQPDIFLAGLTYLQQVSDATSSAALHVEAGIWINVPSTTKPQNPATVVRLATIPHGDSVLAQGTGFTNPQPNIQPVSSLPVPADPGGPPLNPGYTAPYLLPPPPGVDINILNPNAALTDAIKEQTITNTVTLQITTSTTNANPNLALAGGILNIPFVNTNANAIQLDATFWIETVQQPDGTSFLQLQYSQTVILNFQDINWPHISVATLVKQ